MKLKTILIDDEPLALDRLARLLKPHAAYIEIVERAGSGWEAVEKVNAEEPDLIFLDIQMPELTGFEVLEKIKHVPSIIFTTAYDEYALQAFETNSIDYLLKPIDPARLQKALDKLRRLRQDDELSAQARLEKLLLDLRQPYPKRIQVRVGDRIRLLDLQDIYFFKADEKYVSVHTFDENFLLSTTLNKLERELPSGDFVRTHRSAIVNLNHLAEIVKRSGGNFQIKMRDKGQAILPVSRGFKVKLGLG